MKSFLIGILLVLIVIAAVSVFYFKGPEISEQRLKRFSSYEELKNFVRTGKEMYFPYEAGTFTARTMETAVKVPRAAKEVAPATVEYSATNIQVIGVDEADIVKTDGRYIYSVSGSNVSIVDAYPAENATALSRIEVNGTINGIFVNRNKLIIFGGQAYYPILRGGMAIEEIYPYPYYYPKTFVYVYNISDRSNPALARNVSLNGTYFDSRMIGDYVYAIINEPLHYIGDDIVLPAVVEENSIKHVPASEIYYSEAFDYSYIFTSILAINTQNDEEEVACKVFLLGATQNIYVSLENVYIVYGKTYSIYDFYDRIIDQAVLPNVPSGIQDKINEIKSLNISKYEKMERIGRVIENYIDSLNPEQAANFMKNLESKLEVVMKEIAKELEKTIVHKISVANGNIEYKTSGEVPGRILNQFSMDEYNNYFRIATTTGTGWRTTSVNNVYVLDENLKIVGKLEDLAPRERIFAIRFVGDKAYMVTFRRIDPLFVIDMSDPLNPKVLGELKIPGYSDYLHPYDESHLIGVGKDTDERGAELGVKISLFDVSNFSDPREMSKFVIGTRGTYTPASSDHKAFLFSKSKSLLVIPVSLAETPYNQTWQGAYVFNVNLDSGIDLKGRITHFERPYERWYYHEYEIERSLYIDDVLYTVSGKMIKMNGLENLNEINKVEF